MNRFTYFTQPVNDFVNWLAQRLCGAPILFAVPKAKPYQHLHDALAAYQWPPKLKVPLPVKAPGLPYIHPLLPPLPGGSGLAANTALLSSLQSALSTSYSTGATLSNQLAGAVAATLHWGGVYTKPGNGAWLLKNHHQLHDILSEFARDHARGEDVSIVSDLRFNSGMTKVYALLLSDFIIYDSRVAGALAWLALNWWTIWLNRPAGTLPGELKFGCLAANGSMAPFRNPTTAVFPTLWNSPYKHYTWNVRANWILGDAHKLAGGSSRFANLRELEAALFQMGDRVC